MSKEKRLMELAGLQEDTSSVNPTAKRLCQFSSRIDDFITNCEGAGLSYEDVVHAVEELYSQTNDSALGIVVRRWKAPISGGSAPQEPQEVAEDIEFAMEPRYPELQAIVDEMADVICADINQRVAGVQSKMPHKAQWVLEELAKELQKRV